MGNKLSVQQVARETGLSAHTLRYYERAGLLAPVSRAPNGRRLYSEDDLEWIVLLIRLRSTGMPIAEMRRFADLVRQGESTIPEQLASLEAHERRLKTQLEEIEQTLAVLAKKLAHYRVSEVARRSAKTTPSVPE